METKRVLGQNHIKKHFENAIKMGKISHAYIINGEAGTGKLRLAREFAKALQCRDNVPENENKSGLACNECKSCRQTESQNQPDIKYVTYEKTGIGVDEIRVQINSDVDIKPYSSRYKIYIVPECETMTVAAQNALLKTIEEPPEYAIIILLTTNAENFLPTILSRCVLLNMKPVKDEAIKNHLMSSYGVGANEANAAAMFSAGNPGKAEKLISSEDFNDIKRCVVRTMLSMKEGGMDVVSNSIKQIAEFKKEAGEFFELVRIWFRDILIYKANHNPDELIFQEEYGSIREMAEKYTFQDIDIILKSIAQAEIRIQRNVNFDMTLNVLLLTIKERMKK